MPNDYKSLHSLQFLQPKHKSLPISSTIQPTKTLARLSLNNLTYIPKTLRHLLRLLNLQPISNTFPPLAPNHFEHLSSSTSKPFRTPFLLYLQTISNIFPPLPRLLNLETPFIIFVSYSNLQTTSLLLDCTS